MSISKKEMENALNVDLGKLLDLKNLKREDVAHSIGMSSSNLVAGLKGRRSIPIKYFNSLRELLNLNHQIKLQPDMLHVLNVSNPDKQYYYCYDVVRILAHMPLEKIALLDIIDEKSKSLAYVLRTKKNAWILIRDEGRLLHKFDEDVYDEVFFQKHKKDKSNQKIFLLKDYPAAKEISFSDYNEIVKSKSSLEKVQAFVASEDKKVWTWKRIQDSAENKSLSPDDVARLLNLE